MFVKGLIRRRIWNIEWLGWKIKFSQVGRPLWIALARMRLWLRGGGVEFVPPDELFRRLKVELGICDSRPLDEYVKELLDDEPLRHQWETEGLKRSNRKHNSWKDRVQSSRGNVAIYYAIVRCMKPAVVVETGTASGTMTSWILAAIHQNNHGRLVSIDIPPVKGKLTMGSTVDVAEIGYWIPDAYKERWEYRIGDAKVLLPKVLIDQRVDMFVHDSLHTRTHMVFEYAVARCLMAPKTLIASDDILWNNGLDDFLAMNRLHGYAPLSNPNIAAFVNEFDDGELAIGVGIVDPCLDKSAR